jgi:hypothetical protein
LTNYYPNCAPDSALLITAPPLASGQWPALSLPHHLIYPVRGKSASNYGNFLVHKPENEFSAAVYLPARQKMQDHGNGLNADSQTKNVRATGFSTEADPAQFHQSYR